MEIGWNPKKCSESPASWRLGGSNLRGRPRQADLKTAVNRVYYALFHKLAIMAADAATSRGARSRKTIAWTRTARALDHRTARQECERIVGQALLSAGARQFAQTFVKMQVLRHEADYEDYTRFTRNQVTTWIEEAEVAIAAVNRETQEIQRALATMAMHRRRGN